MKREDGWRGRFAKFVTAAPGRPFSWEGWNCVRFVCGGIQAVTLVDLHAPFEGRYTSEEEARAVLAAEGYADIADVAAAHLPEIPPARLRIADVAAIAVDGGFSLGLVIGERIGVLHPGGYATVPLLRATRGFQVG